MSDSNELRNIGSHIRSLRDAKGLSQEELGEKVGLTRDSVGGIERGKIYPRGDFLIKCSQLFDCTSDELLRIERRTTSSNPAVRSCVKTIESMKEEDQKLVARILNLVAMELSL